METVWTGLLSWIPRGAVGLVGWVWIGFLFIRGRSPWHRFISVGWGAVWLGVSGDLEAMRWGWMALGVAGFLLLSKWERWSALVWAPVPVALAGIVETLLARIRPPRWVTVPSAAVMGGFLSGWLLGKPLLGGWGAMVWGTVSGLGSTFNAARQMVVFCGVMALTAVVDPATRIALAPVWLGGTVVWALTLLVERMWEGTVHVTRWRSVVWWTGLIGLVGLWTGFWYPPSGPTSEKPILIGQWFGLQIIPRALWSSSLHRLSATFHRDAGSCWTVPWTPGQAIQTRWAVYRRRPCRDVETWRLGFYADGVPLAEARSLPVCVWPFMSWVEWEDTIAFPTSLDVRARSLTICSQFEPDRDGPPLTVQLIHSHPLPPLLILERVSVVQMGPHTVRFAVTVRNPRAQAFEGILFAGMVRRGTLREPLFWLGIQRWEGHIASGTRYRWEGEVRLIHTPDTGAFALRAVKKGGEWGYIVGIPIEK